MSPRQLRARLTLGIALGGLLLLLAVPLGYLVDKTAWANGVIEEIEPRHARLLGLEEVGERIERERAKADATLAALVYPASLDIDRAGADLQQRLRSVAQQAGLNILGSQIVTVPPSPVRDGAPAELFERIAVNINLIADLSALQNMLAALQQQQPTILVESLSLRPERDTGEGARLNVQARLNAFRVMQ